MALGMGATRLAAQVPTPDEGQISIELTAEGAGRVGEATLTSAGEATQVSIEVAGAPTDGSVEGFLVAGTCTEPGEVMAELGAIEADAAGSGTLSSEVPIDIETLASAPLAIELRQEGSRVACGQHMAMAEGGAAPLSGG